MSAPPNGRAGKRAAPPVTARHIDGAADWQYLVDRIRAGEALHDSLRDLAAKLVTSGMAAGAVVNFLQGLMESSSAPRDERWLERSTRSRAWSTAPSGSRKRPNRSRSDSGELAAAGKPWRRFTRCSKNGSARNTTSTPPPPRLPPRHRSDCPAIRCGC